LVIEYDPSLYHFFPRMVTLNLLNHKEIIIEL